MTWPLYIHCLNDTFCSFFPKCNLLGSFVEDTVEVFTLDSASMYSVWVCVSVRCTFVRVYVRAFHKSQHQFNFFFFFFAFNYYYFLVICYSPKQAEPRSWIVNN